MRKSLFVGVIAVLAAMLCTSFAGVDTGYSLFMGTDALHNVMRVIMVIGLTILLVTSQPRSLAIRASLVAIIALLAFATVGEIVRQTTGVFDIATYIVTMLALGIEALEPSAKPVVRSTTV